MVSIGTVSGRVSDANDSFRGDAVLRRRNRGLSHALSKIQHQKRLLDVEVHQDRFPHGNELSPPFPDVPVLAGCMAAAAILKPAETLYGSIIPSAQTAAYDADGELIGIEILG